MRGADSSVKASRIELGRGENSQGHLFGDDGAEITADQIRIAEMGATGSLKLTDGAKLVANGMNIADNSGSVANVEVSRGAKIDITDYLEIGQFTNGYMDDDGPALSIEDGQTKVDFLISDGGVVSVDGYFGVAARWQLEDGIAAGNEGSEVNLTISGAGSLLDVKKDWAALGVSKNGVAKVKVLDGGKAILGEGANFGRNSDQFDLFGGEGHLTIDGLGSTVEFIEGSDQSINFARGQETVGSLTISNGGTLIANQIEAGREGGSATINVQGDTTTKVTEITAARFSGSNAIINISDGATLELEERLDLANFAFGDVYDDGNSDFGIANATTTAELNVTNGGVLKLGKHIDAATRWEEKEGVAVGTESAVVNINVSGAGSKIESADNTSFFGVSKDGVANVMVSDGGTIVFGKGAIFGEAAEDFSLKGGEGNLTVTGQESTVSFIGEDFNELKFAQGEGTKATFIVSDGGHVSAGQLMGGNDGGTADIDIDGGSVEISYKGEDQYSGWAIVGNGASSTASTLDVSNGGSLVIDGNGKLIPYFGTARLEGSEGHVTISGTGSSLTLLNDNPRTEPDAEFGNGFIQIGRNGTSTFSIVDGATVTNTQAGIVTIGQEATSTASVVVDGVGTVFNIGAMLYVGNEDESNDVSMSIINGATLSRQGNYINNDGETVNGVRLEGQSAKLTIDAASTINANLEIIGGNFIVSDAVETVDINGELTHTGGEIDLQIAGTASHDKLVVTQNAELKGELNITFEGGYTGAVGDSIELFNATSFDIGDGFSLDIAGLAAGLDAQLQVDGTVASLVIFDSEVADFAIV